MRDRADGDPVEHFLEDGVAPAVIGGGPPESPFDVEPDPEPPPGRRAQQPPPRRREPDHRVEPPTNPIPVVRSLPREEEQKRKSWVARMFRLPER
ncbi:hypothetical protein [Actinophytocola sp. KF-1]